jgi:CBS domain-containing protein
MRAKEILMTKSPKIHAVGPDEQIRKAASLLAEYNIGLLPVLDEAGKLLGVVSERDIVREAVTSVGPLFDKPVQSIMTRHLIVATPDDELEYLVNAMLQRNIRHLPVLDEDELIGILSIKDVMQAMEVKYEGELHHWRHYAAGEHA